MKLTIKINDLLTPEYCERLEDSLRDFLKSKGLTGKIDDDITGNTTIFEG